MYQSQQNPQNPQNPRQHSNFYYDQTQPGRFVAPPPPPPVRKPGLGAWWRRRRRGTKIVLGCLSVPVILFTLLFCTAVYQAAMGQVPTPTATAVPSFAQVAKATATQVKPTSIPTPTPTPTPKSTATPMPVVRPTPTPVPQATQALAPVQQATHPPAPPAKTGVNGNPWGYDFNSSGGQHVYNPPANFCTAGYFRCIASFWNGRGYVEQCQDNEFSKSGGIQGSCSYHGGNKQPLYAH